MFEQIHTVFAAGDVRHAVLIVGIALTLWAAAADLTRFQIPNRIVVALFVAGAVWILVSGTATGPHLAASAVVLALGFAVYCTGALGAGDAKLLAALALWMGPAGAVVLVLKTLFFGGILALVWMASRPVRAAMIAVRLPIDPNPPAQIPYAVAIAAAALLSFAAQWPALG